MNNPDFNVENKGSVLETETTVSEEDLLQSLLEAIDTETAKELDIDSVNSESELSEQQVNYFIKKYKELTKEQENICETASKYIEDITNKTRAWEEKKTRSLQNNKDYIEQLLRGYLAKNLTGKKRSISFVEGSVGLRSVPLHFDYDEDQLREFIQRTNHTEFLVPIKPKVNRTAVKNASEIKNGILYLDGQAVRGVLITQKPDAFVIR